MPASPATTDVLDREFLTLRARLIDLAAALDRIDRAAGPITDDPVADDPRTAQIARSLEILASEGPDRAERVQGVFSLPYREGWREEYGG